jgi:GTPase
VSVPQRFQHDVLIDTLVALLPNGPLHFPMGEITDEPEETLVGELIRQAALESVEDELPHSIMVVVEEMGLREGRPADQPLLHSYASMIVSETPRRPS